MKNRLYDRGNCGFGYVERLMLVQRKLNSSISDLGWLFSDFSNGHVEEEA